MNARTFIQERFGTLPIPERSYLVLMSPRSGSNLLCVHLQKIEYGRPVEGFHFSQRALQEIYGSKGDFSDPYRHIKTVLEYGTVGGVFGLKFSWVEFELFLKKARSLIEPGGFELNDAEMTDVFFPNAAYIHLKRRDKVKQAVSYARAMQTGIWKVDAGQDNAYKNYILEAKYDRKHIETLFDNLLAFDLLWEQYLKRFRLPALELWYEDLAGSYYDKMREVYAFLNIERSEVIEPPLKRQADDKSSDWVQRFRQEMPWLQDPLIAQALVRGDFYTVYLQRTMQYVRGCERTRWSQMPASRSRSLRRFMRRVRNKLERFRLLA